LELEEGDMNRLRFLNLALVGLLALGATGSLMAQEAGETKASAEKMEKTSKMEDPIVVMETSMGNIHIELNPKKAPVTVDNFLSYVREGFYDGLIFHRVIDGFMIQGGGFTPDMIQVPPRDPIKNEAGNGLANDRGTIAMARTPVINSATSQFFINVVDNASLNHKDETGRGFGYCVFGKVIEGMDVVDKIKKVKTTTKGGHKDVPATPVMINRAYVLGEEKTEEKAEEALPEAASGKARVPTQEKAKQKEKLDPKE
jgi:peptidyl-prolyl cis-trans isomerase B (cyclophilin B)